MRTELKTIGLIGGITWLSTLEYYRVLNELVNKDRGGAESARIILYSVNFEDIRKLTVTGDWKGISELMMGIARKLEKAGADCLLIGANTMHTIAPEVQAAISIPLIHIAKETGREISYQHLQKVALLGTKYTMEFDFYKNCLSEYGIQTIIPEVADREYIHRSIYEELGKGLFLEETRNHYIRLIRSLQQQGAEGIILGCTEIPLLIKQEHSPIPVFDTTLIHSKAAVQFALQKNPQEIAI